MNLNPNENSNHEFIGTFLVFGLARALNDFGCGPFEADKFVSWYWKSAGTWSVQSCQMDFDRLARKKLSDRVGYTRKRAEAWGVIDRLFNDAREHGLTFEQVIKAVTFLCPTQEMPFPVQFDGTAASIDLTKREDSPKVLTVDATFFPTLEKLYPFERIGDKVGKTVPIGTTARELDLVTLPFWTMYPDASREEREKAIEFGEGGPLVWTTNNLWSKWRGIHAEKYSDRFWKTPGEKVRQDLLVDNVIPRRPPLLTGVDMDTLPDAETPRPAKPTATAANVAKAKGTGDEGGDVRRLHKDVHGWAL